MSVFVLVLAQVITGTKIAIQLFHVDLPIESYANYKDHSGQGNTILYITLYSITIYFIYCLSLYSAKKAIKVFVASLPI